MGYKALDTNVGTLFNEKMRYEVPRYQRNYVWNDKNWEDLLRDVVFSYKNSSGYGHFLGTLVFEDIISKDKETVSYKNIIDGQQRLTTLQVVLFSLIFILKKWMLSESVKGNRDKIKIIQKRISNLKEYIVFNDNQSLDDRIKIDNGIENFKTLAQLSIKQIDSVSEDDIADYEKLKNDNIRKSFFFVVNYMETNIFDLHSNIESLVEFQTALFDMKLITVSSSNKQEVVNLFEVLNARGLYLKQSELLKNYIFRKLSGGPIIDDVRIKWIEMEDILYKSDIDPDDFIFHFMRAYYDIKDLKKENIYQNLKNEELKSNETNVSKLYKHIENFYSYYVDIAKNTNSTEIEANVYEYFIIKNNKQIRSLLFALKVKKIKINITEVQYNEFLRLILNYFVGFNIGLQRSNQIDTYISSTSNKIFWSENFFEVNKHFLQLMIKLSKYYPSTKVLENQINSIRYSNKIKKGNSKNKLIIYYFKPLYNGAKNDADILIPYDKLTIEHVIPDSSDDEATWTIGNLILVTKKVNNKLKDKPYLQKRTTLLDDDIRYNRDFAREFSDFGLNDIENRTSKLKDIILKNFELDFNDFNKKGIVELKGKEVSEFISLNFENSKAESLMDLLKTSGVQSVVNHIEKNRKIDESIRSSFHAIFR